MKRLALSLALAALLTTGASAAGPVYVDGKAVDAAAQVQDNTTYVSLRAITEALRPDAGVAWATDRAAVSAWDLTLTAKPGETYLEANGRALYIPGGVRLDAGRTLVPVRTLAAALGAQVDWNAATGAVTVTSGSGAIQPAEDYYADDALLWLSRIISAESQGEPLTGKIAVGNVVLNRVKNPQFPSTIYGVIFDDRWGGQFEPVRNGTVYLPPTAESVLAAKLVLDGADVAGNSLYFLAPALTDDHWMMENRPYVMTIGAHWFYE